MKTSGIYLITCRPEGKLPYYYVGQSQNVRLRLTRHKSQLRHGKSHNFRLQRMWNQCGESRFLFEVLEECGIGDLNALEQWWIDEMFGYDRCLNISRDAEAPSRGFKFTREQIERIKEKRKPIAYTDEMRKAISDRMSGENSPMYGRPVSAETRARLSDSKSGEKNHFYGKSGALSPVARRVVGVSMLDGTAVRYECIADSRKDGFLPSKVSTVCNGGRPHHKGYVWYFEDHFVGNVLVTA